MHRLLGALLAAGMLTGCAARQPPDRPARYVEEHLPEADDLLQSLAERRAALHSLRTLARLTYTTPEDSRRAKQLLVAERPDRLRFEVLSPFGTVFVLAASDGTLAAYARDEATVYRGAASAENLERYAQVDLPITTAVDLLLGTPPLHPGNDAVVSLDERQVKLWQDDDRDVQVAWFSATLDPVRYERRNDEGQVLVRATFANYLDVDGVRVATELGLELPQLQRRIDIALSDLEVNMTLADAVFSLETPNGSAEINLDQVNP